MRLYVAITGLAAVHGAAPSSLGRSRSLTAKVQEILAASGAPAPAADAVRPTYDSVLAAFEDGTHPEVQPESTDAGDAGQPEPVGAGDVDELRALRRELAAEQRRRKRAEAALRQRQSDPES